MDFIGVKAALPDCEVRAVTMADVPALVGLVERLTTVVLGAPEVSEAEIRDDLVGPHFDLAQDTVIALRPDGKAVLYGQGDDEHNGTAWVDIYVDPALDDELFNRAASAAAAACIDRIAESVAARGEGTVRVSANLYDNEIRMRSVYESAGLEVERIYWRLERVFADGEVLPAVKTPAGIEIRKVDPYDDVVLSQALELLNDSFREHHGHVDMTLADYTKHWREAEVLDRDAWWFAFEGDRPVGMLLGDERRAEQGAGYVRNVGVIDQARGRGIARSLLLTCFEDYRERGRRSVQLGVDSENTTGATRLYESVGMTSRDSAIALGCELKVG